MTDTGTFGPWLKQRRLALGLTQTDLARQVGCSLATIQKLEANERRPSKPVAARLADCLHIDPHDRPAFVQFARSTTRTALVFEALGNATPWKARLRSAPESLVPATPLVGRDNEIATVRQRLLRRDVRLLTLTGPPGVGKTRVAVEVATEVLDAFTDGVYVVPLASVTDPELVPMSIAQVIGIRDMQGQPVLERVILALQQKHILLVLDNFEQILAATSVVATIVQACSSVTVLVTSRVALRLRGERTIVVPPLALPPVDSIPALDSIVRSGAIALFVARARDAKRDFALTEENAAAVVAICRRLEGLPLAIELVAARSRLLPPAALLARLEGAYGHSPLRLLKGDPDDLPARHHTMRAAITWSYNLLSAAERALFARLGVFVGGCTVAAAEVVCGGGAVQGNGRAALPQVPPVDAQPLDVIGTEVLDGLESLVDKHLLRIGERVGEEPRCLMLEIIREYALERLVASGEAEVLRRRHAEFFLALARDADEGLRGPEQMAWVERLEREHDNLRAALHWAIGAAPELALRLAAMLGHFWYAHGHINEGRRWLEAALARTDGLDSPERARTLQNAGILSEKCGLYGRATDLYEEALALRLRLGDRMGVARSLLNLGAVAYATADLTKAVTRTEEALRLYRELGNRTGIELSLGNLAQIMQASGDLGRAQSLLEESLVLARESRDARSLAITLLNLGSLAIERGTPEQAEPLVREALDTFRKIRDTDSMVESIQTLASTAIVQGASRRAITLLGAVEAAREALSLPVDPVEHAKYNLLVTDSQRHVAKDGWGVAWEEGQAMTLEQAVAYALEEGV